MLKSIKKLNGFLNLVFPGEANMRLGSMHFHAPHAALKQKNYNNFQNVQQYISYFQGLVKFMTKFKLCKPTHFVFKLIIATMSDSLQTSFNCLMKVLPYKCLEWGAPTRSSPRLNWR